MNSLPAAIISATVALLTGCTASMTTYDIDIVTVVSDPEPDGTPYLVYLYAAGRYDCQQSDPDPECLYIDSGTVTVPGEELPLDGVLEDVQDECLYGIYIGVFRSDQLVMYPEPPWTVAKLEEPYSRDGPIELDISVDPFPSAGHFSFCANGTGIEDTVTWY